MSNQDELKAKVIARAWKDPSFKERLLKDPKGALSECGYQIPDHIKVKAIEDKEDSYTFVLPTQPLGREISEHELENIAGGCWCHTMCGMTADSA